MEITSLSVGFIFGAVLGAILLYFVLKSVNIPRTVFDELNNNYIRTKAELQNSQLKISELNDLYKSEKITNLQQTEILNDLKNEMAIVSAEYFSLQNQFREQREIAGKQNAQIEFLTTENQKIFARNAELSAINSSLQQSLKTKRAEIEQIQETAKTEFKNLANEILEEKSRKFTESNKENLDQLLKPLGENLETFKKRVNEVYENEARERFSLNSTIKLMMEQTSKVSQEANNLAAALKGQTKTQGDWGEMILERILEDSGLTKDREYFSQYTIKNEHGENQRPDFVLKLPGNQLVIIDSKVSLNAYERMVSAQNEEDRKQNLMLHVAALKKHIDTLSQKKYDDLKDSLDFTIMFIPVEPAFLAAVHFDSQLWNYAYHKHIILLSPTNLIAYLKLISDVWKRADQNTNALEIAERGGKLYDKFVSFVENLEKVGKNIDQARNSYNDAYKQLATGNDNLVAQTQKLKQLGAKNRKKLSSGLVENAENQIDFND
ncbi:DNA recombination protein RmuC [Chryseobacterium sp. HSC-36S06]|uniref:DNA recombination protein RmuC n=1 Tax=Chryseobacterium sp. HSC-36S06 TaxID=2910970 RepID=UPI00209E32AD|nr:DNA recombination protein RmuC [Chryseobacterium sp. HSC-36S06]MCP2039162.1 DNA recombination protein RmuC [Chryseobacterium sp. HSC-36S06]